MVTSMIITRVLNLPEVLEPNHAYLKIEESGSVSLWMTTKEGGAAELLALPTQVTGPPSLYHGEVGIYSILNYDELLDYSISATHGTVVREGMFITLQVSSTEEDHVNLVVNGDFFTVELKPIFPNTPSITSPNMNEEGMSANGFNVTASAFALNFPDDGATHVSSDWEVATDVDFTDIVFSSYNDAVNKTSITVS